ncbi:poly-beta-1,6-N-acetyl-D-glucosamine biosynthesis protein PgaD [Lysobacter claricitrinus]|uniref:poly-beta-1,6-N-acetyl-D-glucosamine biosynthesis protein PgaD n=1 Tax=Lysobacter claricitrinus TaxID=3367728 RepID=UPI0037DBA9D6
MRWPPLIDEGRVPRWVVVRDIAVTLAAWCVLIALADDLIVMSHYWLAVVFGRVPPTPPWPARTLLLHLTPFLYAALVLIAWLLLFAILKWRRLVRVGPSRRSPPPVDTDEHGRLFGLDATQRATLLSSNVVTVTMQGRAVVGIVVAADSVARPRG